MVTSIVLNSDLQRRA